MLSNKEFPLTYKESFKEVTLFTVKVESICSLPLINPLPLATRESLSKSFPFNIKLESILAPLDTINESLNFNPVFNIKLPLTSKSFPTVILLSNKEIPFTSNESPKNNFPFKFKLESILAPLETNKESLNFKPFFNIKFPRTVKFESTIVFALIFKSA